MAEGACDPAEGREASTLLWANAFLKKGLQKDAIAEYEHAARIFPRDFVARNKLAWLLATSSDASIRDGKRAIEVAEQTVQLSERQRCELSPDSRGCLFGGWSVF